MVFISNVWDEGANVLEAFAEGKVENQEAENAEHDA